MFLGKKFLPYFFNALSLVSVSLAQAQSIEVVHLTWGPDDSSNPGDIADYNGITASAWVNGSEVDCGDFGCAPYPSSNFGGGYAEITQLSPRIGYKWGFEGDLTVDPDETINVTKIAFGYDVLGHNGDALLTFALGSFLITVPLPSTDQTSASGVFGEVGDGEAANGTVTIDLVNGTYTVTYTGTEDGSGEAFGTFVTSGSYSLTGTTSLDLLASRDTGDPVENSFDNQAASGGALEAFYRINDFILWITGFNSTASVYETIPSAFLDPLPLSGFLQRTGDRTKVPLPDTQSVAVIYCKDRSKNFLCEVTPEQNSYYADAVGSSKSIGNNSPELWIRILGARNEISPAVSTTGTSYDRTNWGLQAGADFVLGGTENGTLIGGINLSYNKINLNAHSDIGGGIIDTTKFGVGGSLTWLSDQGFYVDGQLQFGRLESDISATGPGVLATDVTGRVQSLSLEAGKRFAGDTGWSVTPQAQINWASSSFDTFTDTNGDEISIVDGDKSTVRLGVIVEREFDLNDGERDYIYGLANLYHDLDGRTSVDQSGTELASETTGWVGEVGFGAEHIWGNNGTHSKSIFGELAISSSLQGTGTNNGIRGALGVRMTW